MVLAGVAPVRITSGCMGTPGVARSPESRIAAAAYLYAAVPRFRQNWAASVCPTNLASRFLQNHASVRQPATPTTTTADADDLTSALGSN